jgi:hypothetical protein
MNSSLRILRAIAGGTLLHAALAGFCLLCVIPSSSASDHADPIFNRELEAGLTGLFAFPARDGVRMVPVKDAQGSMILDAQGNKTYQLAADANDPKKKNEQPNELVLILAFRRALTVSPPYPELEKFTYTIHLDFHSELDVDNNKTNLARYGGTVLQPEGIGADATISFELDANVQFKSPVRFEGTAWKKSRPIPKPYIGVRDDPFIFPQFFRTNVIAFVVRIPLDNLPAKDDFLIWGTSHRGGVQIDHVGRSQRTQLPRFDSLNTLHPREHVAHLHELDKNPGLMDDVLRNVLTPQFALRPYDFEPDVMFYNRRAGVQIRYPNGRQLEDDVALLTCLQGDCQLFELSQSHPKFSVGPAGRPTKNDKDFFDTFPYLADPWEDSPPPVGRGPTSIMLTSKNKTILIVSLIAVVVVFLLPWVLYFRALRRLRYATQLVAMKSPSRPPAPVGPVGPAPLSTPAHTPPPPPPAVPPQT